jgi:hypothetical protein
LPPVLLVSLEGVVFRRRLILFVVEVSVSCNGVEIEMLRRLIRCWACSVGACGLGFGRIGIALNDL